MHFDNNLTENKDGQTIFLQNTGITSISDATFVNNGQIDIMIDLGELEIRDSEFTNGGKNHIIGLESTIILKNVKIYDSKSG